MAGIDMKLVKCPVCGKNYIPAPLHVYKIKNGTMLVCSWSCLRAYEKEHEKRKEYRRRE